MKREHDLPAASSTVDALMYSLRQGAVALGRDDVQKRLALLDEEQMRTACTQLLNRNPNVASRSWKPEEIEYFVLAWAGCHG